MSVWYSLWYVNIDIFVYDHGVEGWCVISPLGGVLWSKFVWKSKGIVIQSQVLCIRFRFLKPQSLKKNYIT